MRADARVDIEPVDGVSERIDIVWLVIAQHLVGKVVLDRVQSRRDSRNIERDVSRSLTGSIRSPATLAGCRPPPRPSAQVIGQFLQREALGVEQDAVPDPELLRQSLKGWKIVASTPEVQPQPGIRLVSCATARIRRSTPSRAAIVPW